MSEYTQDKQCVEEIDNFPFPSFKEFRTAYLEGIAYPEVDRDIAFRWAQGGLYSTKSLRIIATFLSLLPHFVVIGFIIYTIIYAIVAKNWLYLLALPIFLIALFLFHPGSAAIFGFIRTLFIGLIFAGFIWSLPKIHYGLLAFILALIIMCYAEKTIYKKAVNHLIKAVVEHEDLFCFLWQRGTLNIKFYNGNSCCKEETKELIILKNKDWDIIKDQWLRVIEFFPLGKIENDKIMAINLSMPYASLTVECKKFPQNVKIFITHKIDFRNLWEAIKKRPPNKNEEVLIMCPTKYSKKIFKLLSFRILPKMIVMIYPKESFEKFANPEWEKGEKEALEIMSPIARWIPDVFKY